MLCCISLNPPYGHTWILLPCLAGVPSCYLELLDKQICRTDRPSRAILSSWLSWFHFLFLKGGLLVILMHYITFLSPFLDVTRMSMLPMTSFDCRFFLKRFCVCFNLFELLFLVTPCLIVAVQHCMAWIPIFKKKLHVKNLKWFWTRKQIIKSL